MRNLLLICLFINCYLLKAQEEISILSNDIESFGTLIKPNENTNTVVLIIAGSGPTNRNGNTIAPGINYTNNSLKMLAEKLAEHNIASLRYDKRGVGKSTNDSIRQENITFNDFVNDANNWISYLKKNYDTIVVAGHSLGALVGMLAVQQNETTKFISIAGISSSGYETLKRQLSTNQPQFVTDAALPILENLNQGKKVDSIPEFLNSLFHPKLQAYIMSWLSYDPKIELKKLTIPILVVQGSTDLQITVEEARTMSKVNPKSELVVIENMNHVLKEVSSDMNKNMATYSNPDLSLHQELMKNIIDFIKK